MVGKTIKINISGYDEYGTFQAETVNMDSTTKTTKYSYATLGLYLPEDFIPKIGEWFWK